MKRMMILALGLMLALALATGALAEPVAVEDMVGQEMEDFSIETLSGENYTLYEALETHDLMVINFWASWCGPCQYEFPFLEEAWEKYSDRIGVVALSVEENDTGAILDNFVKEYGLKFTVMSDGDKLNQKFGIYGVPTTIIVNKDKKIVAVEVGAKTSTEEFTNLFDKPAKQRIPTLRTAQQRKTRLRTARLKQTRRKTVLLWTVNPKPARLNAGQSRNKQ